MKCPKCGGQSGFYNEGACLWFNGKTTTVGFKTHRKEYHLVDFRCNTVDCGYTEEVWCKLDIKLKKDTNIIRKDNE